VIPAPALANDDHRDRSQRRLFMPDYRLPDLTYDFGALEPHISGKIMELHHDKHHKTYVDGANTALEQLDDARHKSDFTRLAALERALAFNLSGHILHSLFWQNLTPRGGGQPDGELMQTITRDFGTFEQFKKQMSQAAATIMGSGWAALVWEPIGARLLTTQIYDHQSNLSQAGIPLLVIDAWEHAYYLQYQNRKTEFFAAVWNVWNWADVSERFRAARQVDVNLRAAAGRAAAAGR
jgi:Fe-Mn family superoxide dismutase